MESGSNINFTWTSTRAPRRPGSLRAAFTSGIEVFVTSGLNWSGRGSLSPAHYAVINRAPPTFDAGLSNVHNGLSPALCASATCMQSEKSAAPR